MNLPRWSFFVTFAAMNENEYVDFYCQNLLWQVQLGDGTGYYDNDLRTLNYEAVLHNAKEFKITKDSFISAIKYDASKSKRSINLDALWKLSILIWHWKALHLIYTPKIRDVDQYIKLYLLLKNGLDVESITITGKMPDSNKNTNIVLSSDDVLNDIINSLLDDSFANKIIDDNNIKNYTLGKRRFAQDILDRRTIAYQIARELTDFFCAYNEKSKVDTATKKLIMSILANFSLVTKASNNVDYNKLFSDAKNGRLPICDHCYQPTIIKDVGILDFTIIKTENYVKSDIVRESAKK